AATPDTVAPSAPTSLTATSAGGTQIDLAWTASTDNVAVTGYQVERCQGTGCSSFVQIAAPTDASYRHTDLTPLAPSSYRVRATDAPATFLHDALPISAATPDTVAPSAPTSLTATSAGGTQINLAWTVSTDNVAVAGYQVERCLGAGCSSFVQIAAP